MIVTMYVTDRPQRAEFSDVFPEASVHWDRDIPADYPWVDTPLTIYANRWWLPGRLFATDGYGHAWSWDGERWTRREPRDPQW